MQELPLDHDLSHLRRALQFVNNTRVAIDGGAHQGIWSREMAKHFDEVYAFEPVDANFEVLKDVGVNAIQMGLCGETVQHHFAPGKDNTGQWHVECDQDLENDYPDVAAQCRPLDYFNIKDVDFLKLDVEGYELFALEGARETIINSKPVVLIEDNGLCERYGVKFGAAGKYLESLGYSMVKKMNKDYLYEWG